MNVSMFFNNLAIKMAHFSSSQICGLNSNADVETPNSFWELFKIILVRTLTDLWEYILELIVNFVYVVGRYALALLDFLFVIVRQMIGLNTDFTSIKEVGESDLIFKFIFNDSVLRVIRGLLGFALILLIVFCIFAILKSEYDFIANNGSSNSKKGIMVSTLKALFLMVLVPIISIGGIILSNSLLKALYMATAGGADTSLGTQVFLTSGYTANSYRHYADQNFKIPITFNFDEVTEKDNIVNWGTDGGVQELDESLKAFRESSVWNRGMSTFIMFYMNSFLKMDSVDQLNELYKVNGKVSSYHSVFDTGIETKKQEYYVMADVVDYAMTRNTEIYFKTAEQIYESYYDIYNDTEISKDAKNKMPNYMPIVKNEGTDGKITYDFTSHYIGDENATTYSHKQGATDEAKGAVFMIALRKEIVDGDEVYPYYYPLISSQDNFSTSHYATSKQPVVAKGLFKEGKEPTAIKVVDGQVVFYRDQLNIPTLIDLFPTISYELPPDGTTQDFNNKLLKFGFKSVSSIIGVDLSQFIPYIYYSFDIFNLYSKQTYDLTKLANGQLKLDYVFSQDGITIKHLYKLSEFNIFVLIMATIMLLGIMLKFMFGLARRVLDITLLAITYPAVLSTFPIDNGSRFSGWTKEFINKLLSTYGVIIGINFVLLIVPVIYSLDLLTPAMISGLLSRSVSDFTVGLLNYLLNMLFVIAAFSAIGRFGNMISNVMSGENPNKAENKNGTLVAEGEAMINDLKKVPAKIGNVVTGKFIIDGAKNAIDTVKGFIPGSAIVADIREKQKQRAEQSKPFLLRKPNYDFSSNAGGGSAMGETDNSENNDSEQQNNENTNAAQNAEANAAASNAAAGAAAAAGLGNEEATTQQAQTAAESAGKADGSASEEKSNEAAKSAAKAVTGSADDSKEDEQSNKDKKDVTAEKSGSADGSKRDEESKNKKTVTAENSDSKDNEENEPEMEREKLSYSEYNKKKKKYARDQAELNYADRDKEGYKKFLADNGSEDNDDSRRAFYQQENKKASDAFQDFTKNPGAKDSREVWEKFKNNRESANFEAERANEDADKYVNADSDGYKKYLKENGKNDSIQTRVDYYNDRKQNEDKEKFKNMRDTGKFLSFENRSSEENTKFLNEFTKDNSEYQKYLQESGRKDSNAAKANFYVSKRNEAAKGDVGKKQEFEEQKIRSVINSGSAESGFAINYGKDKMKNVEKYANFHKNDYENYRKKNNLDDSADSRVRFFANEQVTQNKTDFNKKFNAAIPLVHEMLRGRELSEPTGNNTKRPRH